MYQFPPVGGSPVYAEIRTGSTDSNKEVLRRLGSLAWNSVTDVIELVEQERMKLDPGYADAVLRLRVRDCTEDDVKIFNSRVVKSEDNPDGVSLDTPSSLKRCSDCFNKLPASCDQHYEGES